jgi:hypothetical protein
MTTLLEQMSLVSTPDKLLISPAKTSEMEHANVIVIHRGTGQVVVEPASKHLPVPTSIPSKRKVIYGVVGLAEVPNSGPLLVVLTRKIRQGELPGANTVWRVDATEVSKPH